MAENQPENQFTSRNNLLVGISLFFKNWIPPMASLAEKNLQIKEYCFR